MNALHAVHRCAPARPRIALKPLIAAAAWLALMACGLWLATHDPAYLSALAQRITGGAS